AFRYRMQCFNLGRDMRIYDVDTSFFLGRECVGTMERLGVNTGSSSERMGRDVLESECSRLSEASLRLVEHGEAYSERVEIVNNVKNMDLRRMETTRNSHE
ncbi:hypothetical protein A2U01_0043853, partial [Trifolium medium]|nr:hypothetical protein [Trifolium medium]